MILTMIVLGFVIVLFIFEWVRVDVVGIIMMVLLPLIGLVSPKEAFLGLSSNAVVSIMAVIIIGAGLDKTGVMNKVAGPIVKLAGNSEKKVITLISGTVGIISSMMQNIGAAALFLPAAQRIGKRMGVPVSRILMPMGFCAIIFVLPAAEGEAEKGVTALLMEAYQGLEHIFEIRIPASTDGPRTLENLAIRPKFLVTVVAISFTSENEKTFVPKSSDMISPGDDIAVIGKVKMVHMLAEEYGWEIKDGLDIFAESLAVINAGMAETVVSPRSELIGKTMSQINFKELYGVNPVALFTGNKIIYSNLTHIRLQMGDTLLLQGPWEKFHILRNQPQPRALTFATALEGEIMRPKKAKLAVIWLTVALAQIIFFKTQLSVALMSGALGMIITGVLSADEAYRAVDWMTVFLLAGLIPLGVAFEKTGTAAFIAEFVLGLLGHPTPIVLLAAVGVMTSFFTLVISNVGATVLLVPLCMNMAFMAGGDPRMAALVVVFYRHIKSTR
jgi:di/tricarboxylate transporter